MCVCVCVCVCVKGLLIESPSHRPICVCNEFICIM